MDRDEFLRKRMERQKKIRKRRLTAFFIFFLLLLIAVGVVLSLTVFFPITDISVKGNKKYSVEEILKSCDVKKGDNIFTVSEEDTEAALMARLPYIEDVTLKRKLPGNLEITVKDAKEYACYKIENKYYIVSRNNWVLSQVYEAPKDLIIISVKDINCKVGEGVEFKNPSQKQLLDDIIEYVEAKKLKLNAVDVTNIVGLEIRVNDRFDVLLGYSNNIEEKISHLTVMIEGIPENEEGTINLSMWTGGDPMGTFSKNKSKK